jgi:hypothetical protein
MWTSVRGFAKDFFKYNGFSVLESHRGVICFRYREYVDPSGFITSFETYAKRLFPGTRFNVDVDPFSRKVCVFIFSE